MDIVIESLAEEWHNLVRLNRTRCLRSVSGRAVGSCNAASPATLPCHEFSCRIPARVSVDNYLHTKIHSCRLRFAGSLGWLTNNSLLLKLVSSFDLRHKCQSRILKIRFTRSALCMTE